MEMIMRDVNTLMERLSFPADARKVLDAALCDIAKDGDASAWFQQYVADYRKNEGPLDYKRLLQEGAALSERLGMHGFTMAMLFFLALALSFKLEFPFFVTISGSDNTISSKDGFTIP